MPLVRAPAAGGDTIRQVLPTLNTSAQMWGLPGVPITAGIGTGSPGAHYSMVEVLRSLTITTLMSVVTTGPAGDESLRFGVWQHDPATGKPGTLVTDFGTVAVTAAATGLFSVAGTAALDPGEYWVGVRQSAFFACRTWTRSAVGVSSAGADSPPALYGSPSASAFGDAPTIADFDLARTFLLARWT